MNRILMPLLILLIFLMGSPALSGQLDEKNLLSAVYERLIWEKKIGNLKLEHLSIQKKIHIDFTGLSLWAVRINIKLESPTKEVKTGILDLITDDNGQWQFEGNVSDLKNGYPLLERAWVELTKLEINPRIGQVIFSGEGQKNIVFITENFCAFCRTFYQTLPVYRDRVNEVVSIYFPLESHPGAELACSVSSYVHSQKNLKQYTRQVDDFIFNELEPPETRDINAANATVYKAFKSKFPWFAEEFSNLTVEKAFGKVRAGSTIGEQIKYARDLNRIGTPIIFVDGKRIDGLDWNKFERFLSY